MRHALPHGAAAEPATTTLGAALARGRLEHRAVRLEQVLAALRDRAIYRAAHGGVPEPLQQGIAGFSAELEELRARL